MRKQPSGVVTRLTLDLWHPNCWAIESTEDAGGGVLAHAIYDAPTTDAPSSVNGLFTAYGETAAEVETLLDTIDDSPHSGAVQELHTRFGQRAGNTPGQVVREYHPKDMICPTLLEHGFVHSALLDEKRGANASTLSGGQRQVLAFARALVMEPDVLLIDEPSAGLAPNTADEVFDDVLAVNDLGTAILMVEQNAKKGLAISDRGFVLDQGTVRFEDDADALLDNPEVSRLYLGG